MANRVFVSFRNGDDPYAAALLFRALGRRFGRDAVFRSSDSIPPGAPWAETIWRNHLSSEVLVAVIGPRWLDIRDGRGRLRLHQEGDWVREEIAAALKQGKLVIPVVLDGIAHLDPRKLPEDIARIAELQAVRMDHRRIDTAVALLIERITEVFADADERTNHSSMDMDKEPASENWLGVWNAPPPSCFSVDHGDLMDALRMDTSTSADLIIASRASRWGSLPVRRLRIPGFAREQSVRLLGERLADTSWEDLNRLAAALAADFISESAMSPAQYADLIGARPASCWTGVRRAATRGQRRGRWDWMRWPRRPLRRCRC
ncbi:toll/interleukin-1 receptor domain-containing protein [Catenulispora rubra]|uniref:toll/interleukin-1 receptor domain-containing protein n=1 Tax=Catenulispora rubra TaxID=280293 RepID=UPI0018920E2F|nr:toll/interleukin-1 receptor domain-containing protein [Catenulispora rubra]